MHRRFSDAAGYTCHCWECKHAKGWVGKYDSPNNPSSRIPNGCNYDWGEA